MVAEASIGRLLAPRELRAWPAGEVRSAFVISADYVLSAWHCVEAVGGKTARAWLRLQPAEGTDAVIDVPVSYRAHRAELDAALLTVDAERLNGDPETLRGYLNQIALPLGLTVRPHSAVRVGGFPERNPARFPTLFVGRVESADALIGAAKAVRVYVPEFAARYAEWPGGMSGGPLLYGSGAHRERVVGMVSAYPQAPGDAGATGATVICRRTADLRRAFPEIDHVLRQSGVPGASARGGAVPTGSRVYISSSPGLPGDYREAAAEVCRRHGLTPVDPSSFSPALRASEDVRRQEMIMCRVLVLLLVGGQADSGFAATEYDWAIADSRKIVLPFLTMPHPASPADLVVTDGLVERVETDQQVLPLSDPGTFRLDLYQAIERYKHVRSAKSRPKVAGWRAWGELSRELPSPPDLCAMPPYVGGSPFTGRGSELDSLDAWARSGDPVMVVDAIGGTGKSALTWEWMTTRAAQTIDGLAGSFWWSFYDRSASMERFLRELLGYLRAESDLQVGRVPRDELSSHIVHELRQRPFLVVLDGFERLLVAYHQYDPARVTDEDVDADRRTNKNAIVDALGYEFVRLLVTTSPSKILISTRILPDALEQPGGTARHGTVQVHLPGLSDVDTRVLLGRLGITGHADTIKSYFAPLDNHPLLVAIVAGMVRDFRPAPGDFGAWLQRQPLKVGDVHLAERKNHILAAALDGLDTDVGRLLGWLSALPGSVQWHVVESVNPYRERLGVTSPNAGALLDAALRDLEVRGLVWWNRNANTYDMHPIVRAVAAARMGSSERIGANERIADFFQAEPPEQPETVTSVEDLQQPIALFRALTGAQKYSSATFVWNNQLAGPLLYSLGANATVAELLQPYEGTNYTALRADLSISLHLANDHDRGLAVELATLDNLMRPKELLRSEILTSLGRLATHFRSMGKLAAYANVLHLLSIGTRDSSASQRLGLTLRKAILDTINGNHAAARSALDGLEDFGLSSGNNPWFRGDVRYWRLVLELWSGVGLQEDAIAAAEEEFPSWRNRLRLNGLRFETFVSRRTYASAKSAADDIDRLRRLGGQQAMPAENAFALACLGQRAEAEAAIEGCLAALPRVHPFDRPYYLLARALAKVHRYDESAKMAKMARQRAWADGPNYCYRWDFSNAEVLLKHLGVPLPPLLSAGSKHATIPNQRTVERILR